MSYRKKLIEVSLPLEAINAESIRRKQKAPKGFPTAIHKYWAQRPIAACRAVLFAQLVDDPSSCPEEFPTVDEQESERKRLHGVIDAMVAWDASELSLHTARYEIARSVARNGGPALSAEWRKPAHARDVIDYLQAHAPPVHDPFSGGASIPLEAQRLGLRASGSDLNPVAVLIGKALVEFPSKFADMTPINSEADRHVSWRGAKGLADDVRFYGRWIREKAAERVGHLYPKVKLADGGEATVIAWLWARTIASPDPRAKGMHVPLVTSFVVSAKKGHEVIVRPEIDRGAMSWALTIDDRPTAEAVATARRGTKSARGANFTCLLTGEAISDKYVKAEGMAGRLGERLLAIVVDKNSKRLYFPPDVAQEQVALAVDGADITGIDQAVPERLTGGTCYGYGLTSYDKLFTARQLTVLSCFSDLVGEARSQVIADASERWFDVETKNDLRDISNGGMGPAAYADAISVYLALVVDRMIFYGSTLCRWLSKDNAMGQSMGKQAFAMTWDFAEGNHLGDSSAAIQTCLKAVADVLELVPAYGEATIVHGDARDLPPPAEHLLCTDPPYYDNVAYADLSDFFYVWLRRGLIDQFPSLFRRIVTDKSREIIVASYRKREGMDSETYFFESMRSVLEGTGRSNFEEPAAIFYAYKQSEVTDDGLTAPGWSSFLQATTDAGLAIDGTWPVRSESAGRLVAMGTNALASSIVLVCRRRESGADTITRPDFLRRLRAEMPAALATIRAAGVGPTDIQQAAIGPGIGIFTRYAAVLNTDGEPMSVRDALKLVNQVREEIASEGEGDYDAETRFAIDWFAIQGFAAGKSSDAISMANAANLGLADLERAGVLEAKSGGARLLRRAEMPVDWDPRKDKRPTAWEACQHLIRRLEAEDGGVDAAAQLFAVLGDLAEPAQRLAFRLYDICEKKGWHAEGRPYNLLIQEWAEIENRAFALRAAPPAQGEMAV